MQCYILVQQCICYILNTWKEVAAVVWEVFIDASILFSVHENSSLLEFIAFDVDSNWPEMPCSLVVDKAYWVWVCDNRKIRSGVEYYLNQCFKNISAPSFLLFFLCHYVPQHSILSWRVLSILFIFPFPQGVKPASYNKVMDPEIKEIIGECICQKKEERWVTAIIVQCPANTACKVPSHLSCLVLPPPTSLLWCWQLGSHQHCSLSPYLQGVFQICFIMSLCTGGK